MSTTPPPGKPKIDKRTITDKRTDSDSMELKGKVRKME